ncbi:alpha/beta fold hydrolase [Streptomyces sp. NPDC046831]|uniref:alpha/beta fold hydrolase n=1 Tax=Streptomyces sp. NPDC046831 TaxID=3154805 RepID=UPI0033DA8324
MAADARNPLTGAPAPERTGPGRPEHPGRPDPADLSARSGRPARPEGRQGHSVRPAEPGRPATPWDTAFGAGPADTPEPGRTRTEPPAGRSPAATGTAPPDTPDPTRAVRSTELPDGTPQAGQRPAPAPTPLPDTAATHDVPALLPAHGCWYPSVDPGGRYVAFICDRTGVPQLWAGPVDGDEARLLDAGPHPVTEVSWSPDGRWIAYTAAPGGGEHTRVLCVRPDGTGRRILAGGEPDSSAYLGCWQHDGSAVAVTVAEAVPHPGAEDAASAGLDVAALYRPGGRSAGGLRTPLHGAAFAHGAPPHGPRPPFGSAPGTPSVPRTADGGSAVPGTTRVGPSAAANGGARGREPAPKTLSAYLVDPDGVAAPVLIASERGAATLRVCDLSRDGRFALVRRGPRGRREALVVRVPDLRVTCALRVADGDPWIGGFSPDSRTLWLRSDHEREYAALYAVRLDARGERLGLAVAAHRDDCDLELLALDRNGRSAVLSWNVRGVSELEVAALAQRRDAGGRDTHGSAQGGTADAGDVAAPDSPAAPETSVRPSAGATAEGTAEPSLPGPADGTAESAPATRVEDAARPPRDAGGLPESAVGPTRTVPLPHEVVTRVAVTSDPDAPVVALSGSQRRPGVWWLPQGTPLRTPWSSGDEAVALTGHRPVRPVPLRPVARDGLALGGWYYRAPGRPANTPAPCVLYLHGGPEDQERPVFEPLFHELLGRGLDVFAPDVRGSSGYGRSFVDADLGTGRFAAIQDVADCAAHVMIEGLADPRRLAVLGHSYGGYLVMASLVWHPELFRTGVPVCGMSDFASFFAGTEPWIAESAAHKYGHPVRDRELLHALSPMSRVDALRVPVLAVHGEHDTNVPPGESEQFVRAARERGLEAEVLVLHEEGHYFRRADNRRLFRRRAADWIERHLAG